MSADEATRFMAGNRHPMREVVAEVIGDRYVTDLGCGKAIRIKDLYTREQYVGVECSPELFKIAVSDNPGYVFHNYGILEYLSLIPDKSLPVALMVSVLEHQPSLEIAQRIYREALRCSEELLVGWNTPPNYPETKIIQVQAELDQPIYQNRYMRGSFDGNISVRHVGYTELWTVRS
jgi:SAM-dependent methyltransferase